MRYNIKPIGRGRMVVRLGLTAVLTLAATTQAVTPVFSKSVTSLISDAGGVALPLRAGSMAIADFNGDGRLDIAIPGIYIAGVAVFRDNGTAMAIQTWYDAGRTPMGLAAADFDGDGDTDLAVVLKGEGGVAILTNDGAGQFTRTSFIATAAGAISIAAADLNLDGRVDLVVANQADGSISKLTNTAQGFAVRQTVFFPSVLPAPIPPVSCQPVAMTIADLDGNGWPDVAVACAGDDTVRIVSNHFGLLTVTGRYVGGPSPIAVAAADLDGDLLLDLVVADREAPQLTLLKQDMAGLFTPQDLMLVQVPYGAFTAPTDVTLLDLDGNRSTDILTNGYTLHNDGLGHFTIQGSLGVVVQGRAIRHVPPLRRTYIATAATQHLSAPMVQMEYVPDAWVTGDLNGDDIVSAADLQQLVAGWGTAYGEPGYDPYADMNHDQRINIGDLQLLVLNWGRMGL